MRNQDDNDNFNFPTVNGGQTPERHRDAIGAGGDGDDGQPEHRPALWEAGLGAIMAGGRKQRTLRQGVRRLKRKVIGFFVMLILLGIAGGWLYFSGVAAGAEGAAPNAKEPAVVVEEPAASEEPGEEPSDSPKEKGKEAVTEKFEDGCENQVPRVGTAGIAGMREIGSRAAFEAAVTANELVEQNVLAMYGCWLGNPELARLAEAQPNMRTLFLSDTAVTDVSALSATTLSRLFIEGSYDVNLATVANLPALKAIVLGSWAPGSIDGLETAPVYEIHVDGRLGAEIDISKIGRAPTHMVMGKYLTREPGAE